VRATSLFALELFDGHWVINGLRLLGSKFALLQTGKYRRLPALTEGYDHERKRVGRQVTIRSAYNFYAFCPMLQENCQNVESLVDLTIRVDQIRVVHREHIVYRDVDINASFTVLVLE